MKKEFDFDRIGKRMPYTTPDGFFDQLEEDVWKKVKPVKTYRLLVRKALAVAASIALVFAIGTHFFKTEQTSLGDVDQAFSQLATSDQAYLLSVYQEDVFIQE